jgi:hypothetical protein
MTYLRLFILFVLCSVSTAKEEVGQLQNKFAKAHEEWAMIVNARSMTFALKPDLKAIARELKEWEESKAAYRKFEAAVDEEYRKYRFQ